MQTSLASLIFVGLLASSHAGNLRKVGEATTAAVETSLIAELAGNVSSYRLADLEAALLPMYSSLPRGPEGYVDHQVVRYALHRLLLQRHGWFIVGLEPTAEALPPYLHGEWVPQYLQGLLEQRLGGRGLNLHEIAALAATLEDLVHAEAAERVDRVYKLLELPIAGQLSSQQADQLLEAYMLMYLDGGNFSAPKEGLVEMATFFKKEYGDWAAAESWVREIKQQYLKRSSGSGLDHAAVVSIVNELGQRFGAYNDGECRSLKSELLGMQSQRPARVLLTDFYRKGLHSHWQFNEKEGYLRALGALDESDASRPSVIVPNYLGSRTNCLAASSLYSVCCRNECEDLMAHLELEIAAPTADPKRIQELVTNLPASSAVDAPVLTETLVQRLQGIAQRHRGKVPLHGRLFSQWLHHAFPRECPFPHGGANPQTPDAWMREAGATEGTRASEDELRQLLGQCVSGPCTESTDDIIEELPWSDEERLLVPSSSAVAVDPLLRALALLLVVGAAAPGLVKKLHSQVRASPDYRAELELAGETLKPTWSPWQVLLLMSASALLLEYVGLLDRVTFICTLAGGLALAFVLPLVLYGSHGRRSKKHEDYL